MSFILFFSNSCQYSQHVIKLISGNQQVQSKFVLVNIDNPNLKIPAFVDRVPLVFLQSNKRIIVEDDIVNFIDSLRPAHAQQQQQQKAADGEMLSLSDISKGFSDSYSFIGNDDQLSGELEPKNFVFIDEARGGGGGSTNKANNNGTSSGDKPPKFDSKMFDSYMMQRDNDMTRMFPGKQGRD
jgi:hypothetical protein